MSILGPNTRAAIAILFAIVSVIFYVSCEQGKPLSYSAETDEPGLDLSQSKNSVLQTELSLRSSEGQLDSTISAVESIVADTVPASIFFNEFTDIRHQFGREIDSIVNLDLACHWYLQDQPEGSGTRIGNWTRVEGEILFGNHQIEDIYPAFQWEWWVNGERVSNIANPKVNHMHFRYSGIQWLEMRCHHRTTGTHFRRGMWSYMHMTWLPDVGQNQYVPPGQTAPTSRNQIFNDWWIPYDEYNTFQIDNDYDLNGIVTASDVTQYLTKFKR